MGWVPPEAAPPLSWDAVQASLRAANRWPSPHCLNPEWLPAQGRRAAVAVLLWGDAEGARKVVLVQRGASAPKHAGELAFPGGTVEPFDRDLPATARRELAEELGITEQLWELGCFPDGLAKQRARFTPVFYRWEAPVLTAEPGPEIEAMLALPILPLKAAPWREELLQPTGGQPFLCPRLDLEGVPLWGATARVLKAWLDLV